MSGVPALGLTDYDTSIQYQALTITFFGLAYALGIQFVWTLLSLWHATNGHEYGLGKRPRNSNPPLYGDHGYWYRWLIAAPVFGPTWVWILMTFVVAGLFGAAAGLFAWIVNDYTNAYWLTCICFFMLIPILAGAWAIFLFHCRWLGASLAMALIYMVSSGVLAGMSIAYPYMSIQTGNYFTYQWIAFGMGAAVQFVWSLYVFGIACHLYVKNNNRTYSQPAADESMEERTAALTHIEGNRTQIHSQFAELRQEQWKQHELKLRGVSHHF